jgi:hypothetical protein
VPTDDWLQHVQQQFAVNLDTVIRLIQYLGPKVSSPELCRTGSITELFLRCKAYSLGNLFTCSVIVLVHFVHVVALTATAQQLRAATAASATVSASSM